MAANKESLFKIGQNTMNNALNKGSSLFNKVDFTNIVPNPTQEQMEANYLNRISNFVEPAISKGTEVLQGLQDFAKQSVQPGQTNVMEQGDLYGPIDQEPQQQGFMRPLIDYAKSPDGAQMIADTLRLGFAATRKDPIVAGTMAQSLSKELAQRPIEAAKRKKAAQDEEMFNLNKLQKQLEINKLAAEPQTQLNKSIENEKKDYLNYVRGLNKDNITKLNKNEDITKFPRSVLLNVDNPITAEKDTYINRREYKLLYDDAKANLGRIKKTRQQLDNIDSAINKLMFVNKDGQADLTALGDAAAASSVFEGITQSFLAEKGGGKATAAKALIDQIKANLGFRELQDMRDNSKTGGALGGISNTEIGFLQGASSILRMNLKEEDMLNALKDLKRSIALVRKDLSSFQNVDDIIFASEFNTEKDLQDNQSIDVADGFTMDIGEKPKAVDIVPDSPMKPPANNIVTQQQSTTPVNEIPTQNVSPQGPGLETLQGFNPAQGGLGFQMALLKALVEQNARLPRTNTLIQGGPGMGGLGIQNALLNEILNRGRRP